MRLACIITICAIEKTSKKTVALTE